MILYVNGDSHAAAAEAVVPHAWAEDDGLLWGMGRQPHPENARVSFGCELANHLFAILDLDAQAGGSNWGTSYIGPYDPAQTYNAWLKNNGHATVKIQKAIILVQCPLRFGAVYLLQYIVDQQLHLRLK
jgi:hypothetical protein